MDRNYVNIVNSFKTLIAKILEKGVDKSLLIICGDIFESKSFLQTDDIFYYRLICKNLQDSNIRTLIIPGNHDYNTNSEKVRDNISLLSLTYSNIICLNKTNIYVDLYNISNIEFHVFSPIDKEIPKKVTSLKNNLVGVGDVNNSIDSSNRIKIALLHEPVNFAMYDNGTPITNARFNINDLTMYDYVLLGDIHMHQFLDKHIAYSGSFVQKTKGEGIDKGYILWDLENRSGKFYNIPLLEIYIKIEAYKDRCNMIDVLPNQKIRHCTLVYKDCSTDFVEKLKQEVISKYGYINRIIDNSKIGVNITSENIKEEVKTHDHSEIIKSIIKDEDKAQAILEHHNNILDNRTELVFTTYKINYLIWSNIFCYGEDNYINFNDFNNDLIMLNGKNKEGKSSIIDILIRALFNECERGFKEDIVNKTKTRGYIKLSFNVGADEYIIEQIFYRISKNQHHRLYKNGENITQDTIVNTYSYLRNTIGLGDYKNFVNLTTALQNRKFLVDMPQKDLISLLTKITNVDILKDIEEQNKKEISTLKAMCKKFESDLKSLPEIKEEEIKDLSSEKELLTQQRDKYYSNIDTINKQLIEVSKKYDNTNIPEDILELLENTKKEIEKYLKEADAKNVNLSRFNNLESQEINNKIQIINNSLQKIIASLELIPTEIREKSVAAVQKYIADKKLETSNNQTSDQTRDQTRDQTSKNNQTRDQTSKNNQNKDQKDASSLKSIRSELNKKILTLTETTYKPKENIRPIQELEKIISEYKEQELISIERCSIKSLLELNHDYKNDELVNSGLPNYDQIKSNIIDLEKKIEHFNNNFGNLVFESNCDSCCSNQSHIYSIFDIRSEVGNLAFMQDIYSKKDEMELKYKNAVDYKNNSLQNEIFLRNIKAKEQNAIISKNKDNYLKAIDELKEAKNKERWALLKKLEQQENLYKEEDAKALEIKRIKLLFTKEYLVLLNKYNNYIKLQKIKESNGTKIDHINKLNKLEKSAKSNLENINAKLSLVTENFHVKCSQYENRKTLNANITEYAEKIEFLNLYANVVSSKTGIPSYVLKTTCKKVQDKCNFILAKIVDFTIEIIFDKEVKIYTIENDIAIPAQMGSGMQKFLLDLIFRISLTEISSVSCPKTLFVDEGFGALDKENFVGVANILQKLKSNFDSLFIISHISELNNYVDITVDIKRKNFLSQVQHGNLTYNQLEISIAKNMDNNGNKIKEFKDAKKKDKIVKKEQKLDNNDILVRNYCDNNGGIIKILLEVNDKNVFCKGCNKKFIYRDGFSEKHISAQSHIKKHNKFILDLMKSS